MAVNTALDRQVVNTALDKRVVIITANNAVQEDQEANQVGHMVVQVTLTMELQLVVLVTLVQLTLDTLSI